MPQQSSSPGIIVVIPASTRPQYDEQKINGFFQCFGEGFVAEGLLKKLSRENKQAIRAIFSSLQEQIARGIRYEETFYSSSDLTNWIKNLHNPLNLEEADNIGALNIGSNTSLIEEFQGANLSVLQVREAPEEILSISPTFLIPYVPRRSIWNDSKEQIHSFHFQSLDQQQQSIWKKNIKPTQKSLQNSTEHLMLFLPTINVEARPIPIRRQEAKPSAPLQATDLAQYPTPLHLLAAASPLKIEIPPGSSDYLLRSHNSRFPNTSFRIPQDRFIAFAPSPPNQQIHRFHSFHGLIGKYARNSTLIFFSVAPPLPNELLPTLHATTDPASTSAITQTSLESTVTQTPFESFLKGETWKTLNIIGKARRPKGITIQPFSGGKTYNIQPEQMSAFGLNSSQPPKRDDCLKASFDFHQNSDTSWNLGACICLKVERPPQIPEKSNHAR